MAKQLTAAQKGQLFGQYVELTRVTDQGIRSYEEVRQALQNIIDGKGGNTLSFDPATNYRPDWHETPEEQLATVRRWNEERGWGFQETDFPPVPSFTRQTASEVLLLGIYLPGDVVYSRTGLQHTVRELWDVIVAPEGWQKRWGLESQLQYADPRGYYWQPGLRWVAFDHNAYPGKSAKKAHETAEQQGRLLAGVEVLAAAALFPRWADSWNGRSSRSPQMSVCRTYANTGWSYVAFGKCYGSDRTFGPIAESSSFVTRGSASPTVREI